MTFLAQLRYVTRHLERLVDESARGSIATFNDLPPAMVEEARTVRGRGGRLAACHYLGFFVATRSGSDAEDFCEDVLEGGQDAATWRISDCLVGVVEKSREGIQLTIEQYLDALDMAPGERWFRVDPTPDHDSVFRTSGVGPGTLMRGTRYWTTLDAQKPDAPIIRLVVSSPRIAVSRVPDGHVDVEIRRWMAALAAWWAREYLVAEGARATVEGVIAAYPVPVVPSADGLVAIRALVREAQLGDARWPGQIGFLGPDDWYRP